MHGHLLRTRVVDFVFYHLCLARRPSLSKLALKIKRNPIMPNEEETADMSSLLMQYQSCGSGGGLMRGFNVLCFLDCRKNLHIAIGQNCAK